MANSKISDLASLSGQPGDELPVNRSGSDGKVTLPVGLRYTSTGANYLVLSNSTASGVGDDEVFVNPSNRAVISATGSDTNIGIEFASKGAPNPDFVFRGGYVYAVAGSTHLGGPLFVSHYESTAGASGGGYFFTSNNTNGISYSIASFQPVIEDHTAGSEDGYAYIATRRAGAKSIAMGFGDGIFVGVQNFSTDPWPGQGNLGLASGKGIHTRGSGATSESNEALTFTHTTGATNYVDIANSTADPVISAKGDAASVGLTFTAKGSPVIPFTLNCGSNTEPESYIISNSPDQFAGPSITYWHNSTSPAAGDRIGNFNFNGNDSAGNETNYASLGGWIEDTSNGSEDGYIDFETRVNNSKAQRMAVGNGVIIGVSATSFPGVGNLRATGFLQTANTVVNSLPTATTSNIGARHFVTDASTNAFMAPAVGGSTYSVPVVANGTGWVVG
jgi:hypothetical protein